MAQVQFKSQSAQLSFARRLRRACFPIVVVAALFGITEVRAAFACGGAMLSPAVEGHVVVGFGDENPGDTSGAGLHSRGIVYATDGHASVTSPANGTIEFAGPVDTLGNVVIVNIGDGYRVVLTGLDRISVRTGQRVEADDRLGAMPGIGRQTSHLYMELRCGEEPVNPMQPLTIAMR